MTIKKDIKDQSVTITLTGRLDTATAPELEAELDGCIGGARDLVFDFAGLDYISSAGLRVILKAQKTMNKQGSMKLINVNESIMEVFDITGFADILTIE